MEIVDYKDNFIDIICTDSKTSERMRITFIYAPTNFQERLSLWSIIRYIASINHLPWIVAGDFNEILCYWEKVGRREAENSRLIAFQELLYDCSLIDIESKGCAFTWANNREGKALVKKKDSIEYYAT